jgi:hypothetical protein
MEVLNAGLLRGAARDARRGHYTCDLQERLVPFATCMESYAYALQISGHCTLLRALQ